MFLGLLITDFSSEQSKMIAEQDTYKAFCDLVGAVCHKGIVMNFPFFQLIW